MKGDLVKLSVKCGRRDDNLPSGKPPIFVGVPPLPTLDESHKKILQERLETPTFRLNKPLDHQPPAAALMSPGIKE
jgi:hypothetical protein